MAAGAGAVAAGAAGVWMKKEQISEGWGWAFSHLEFVGCLARNAELVQRVEKVVAMEESHGVGFADFYTSLSSDKIGQTTYSAQYLGEQRTFCVVPDKKKKGVKESLRGDSPSPGKKRKVAASEKENKKTKSTGERGSWVRCTNAKAKSETAAHVGMFTPADNPDYFAMGERARGFVEKWIDRQWYEESGEEEKGQAEAQEEAKKESVEEEMQGEAKQKEYEQAGAGQEEAKEDTAMDQDGKSGAEKDEL